MKNLANQFKVKNLTLAAKSDKTACSLADKISTRSSSKHVRCCNTKTCRIFTTSFPWHCGVQSPPVCSFGGSPLFHVASFSPSELKRSTKKSHFSADEPESQEVWGSMWSNKFSIDELGGEFFFSFFSKSLARRWGKANSWKTTVDPQKPPPPLHLFLSSFYTSSAVHKYNIKGDFLLGHKWMTQPSS